MLGFLALIARSLVCLVVTVGTWVVLANLLSFVLEPQIAHILGMVVGGMLGVGAYEWLRLRGAGPTSKGSDEPSEETE